jgi:hypothetical protein
VFVWFDYFFIKTQKNKTPRDCLSLAPTGALFSQTPRGFSQ